MQTRKHSFIESLVNVTVGYAVAIASQMVIFPLFGITTSTGQNLQIAGWFTLISIIRSYCLRRLFNRYHQWQKEAAQ